MTDAHDKGMCTLCPVLERVMKQAVGLGGGWGGGGESATEFIFL